MGLLEDVVVKMADERECSHGGEEEKEEDSRGNGHDAIGGVVSVFEGEDEGVH